MLVSITGLRPAGQPRAAVPTLNNKVAEQETKAGYPGSDSGTRPSSYFNLNQKLLSCLKVNWRHSWGSRLGLSMRPSALTEDRRV